MSTAIERQDFRRPGRSVGLLEVIRQPYLTSLIVHKELRARYRGSVFGMLWSYAKPATQFAVFYFAIGVFMNMNRNIPNFVIYMFSGVIAINYFSEAFGNATRSIVGNAPLVKKIYLPRELFPMSALWVAFVHFLPQLAILLIGALFFGWQPSLTGIGAVLIGFLIISFFSLGLGLFAGAINVFFRDAENFVDLILMVATWTSPVLYKWSMVHDKLSQPLGGFFWLLYQANPLTAAVELFHYGFWHPTLGPDAADPLPPHLLEWGLLGLGFSVLVLVIGEVAFRRMDPRFAQEL
ncbi:ABC transporter permease [Buchananella hordeovulneris]|uniref:Transport permease protein n=1 Tax=Buchananella hordeovulneris TaxID=52770 RepID=A0A1Q5PWA6_9ACTO|nr:ABC transporter permease [Buchananella hordeovulneris]MDO5079795.1 ABC transporter permease [Buchananella hordeovulneris]OKL51847.1 sugar ABC transporter permease [Buchananella hordeovulneris]